MLTAHLIANRVYRTCKTCVLHVQVSSSSCHSENDPALSSPRPSTAMSDHTAFSRMQENPDCRTRSMYACPLSVFLLMIYPALKRMIRQLRYRHGITQL